MEQQKDQPDLAQSELLRDAIRAELAETRRRFHALLATLSDADLQRKSINPAWTIGELLVHIIYWLGRTPQVVEDVRKRRGVRHFPRFLFNWLNIPLTRAAVRTLTCQALAEQYDAAYAETLTVLEGIQPEEWNKGATFIAGEHRTIERIMRSHAPHFEEHAEQIRQSIGL